MATYIDRYNHKDAAGVAALYADDGVLVPPTSMVTGKPIWRRHGRLRSMPVAPIYAITSNRCSRKVTPSSWLVSSLSQYQKGIAQVISSTSISGMVTI